MRTLSIADLLITIIISSIARIVVPVWNFMLGCVAGLIVRWLAGAAFQSTFGHLVALNFQSGAVIPLTLGVLGILYSLFASSSNDSIQVEEMEGGDE